jgi:hypothetical protein
MHPVADRIGREIFASLAWAMLVGAASIYMWVVVPNRFENVRVTPELFAKYNGPREKRKFFAETLFAVGRVLLMGLAIMHWGIRSPSDQM